MTYTENTEAANALLDALSDEEVDMAAWGDPHREPEYRQFITDDKVSLVSDAERAEFQAMLDHEVFEGFGS